MFNLLKFLLKKKLNRKNKKKVLKSASLPTNTQNCRMPKIKVKPVNIKKV